MLSLRRLPAAARVLYVGISVFWVLALGSHWLRLSLRHGVGPQQIAEWYLGNEEDEDAEVFLFEKPWIEVATDSWDNLFHHSIALTVMIGLLVRVRMDRGRMAGIATAATVALPLTAIGPVLVRLGMPGAAHLYLLGLGLLNLTAFLVLALVLREVAQSTASRRASRSVAVAALLALSLLWRIPAAEAQDNSRVLATEEEARVESFPTAFRLEHDTVVVDGELRSALESVLGRPVFETHFAITSAYSDDDSLQGYFVVTEEYGKYRPITMSVSVNADFSVREVSILVYRESRGGEVSRTRFLRQYRGRDSDDPIRINRDITNISGATISVISVNQGVRKILVLLERVYR